MPYIIKEARVPYDELINEIFEHGINNATLMMKTIAYFKSVSNESCDGQFNYFITKLCRKYESFHIKIDLEALRWFLISVIKEVYPPKYFNYNRAIGMLTCCSLEYKRKYTKESFLVTTFLESVITKLYSQVIAPYEDQKEIENGSV